MESKINLPAFYGDKVTASHFSWILSQFLLIFHGDKLDSSQLLHEEVNSSCSNLFYRYEVIVSNYYPWFFIEMKLIPPTIFMEMKLMSPKFHEMKKIPPIL